MKATDVWIGLVDVHPVPGNRIFGDDPGAYSNVISLAGSEAEYRARVTCAMEELGLEVITIENVEPFDRAVADPDLIALANTVSDTKPLVYDTFYVYEKE